MVVSITEEKVFNKIQHSIMITIPCKLGIEGHFLNLIKKIYKKPTASIILTGEKQYICFPTKIRNKVRISLLIIPIQHRTQSPS